jgi:hypothetical protein
MGKSVGESPLMKFHKYNNYDAIGLAKIQYVLSDELVHAFVWYCRSHIDAYNYCRFLNTEGWQTYNASRGIATYQLALLLGIDEYIPKTYYVNFNVDGKRKFGSFMEVASGIHFDDYSKLDKNRVITPRIQRALTTLNLLDAITYEKDHRLNNYNIVLDSTGCAVGVCAYDNDSPLCFSLFPSPHFTTSAGCVPIIKDGAFYRPHCDRKIANRLMSITNKDISNALNPYCNKLQIWACQQRISRLKKAIQLSKKLNPNFLIDENGWSETTVEDELSGKYGKTYLCLLKDIYIK